MMNSSRFSTAFAFTVALVALALTLVLSPMAEAATPKPKPPPDLRILVTAVDAKNQQITITYEKNKTTKVYGIDDMTKVVSQGNPGTLASIKVGQQVYSYVERDDKSLDNIEVAVAQPAPVAPKK
jgi:Cu/Ag efflux protein CusF